LGGHRSRPAISGIGTACDELSRVVADPKIAQGYGFFFDLTGCFSGQRLG
jgi:hypothetical protein